ncbi:hypothetical protein Pint_01999 [Pistacia integerrima]|uniref:Uncharacterized protein n=1 Tax=Pistacia integerrima TaxID=434235 RepID=A0ACC0ZL16_9ROSI|nr:hypothetical protein Pint_01999 [Pistacia integerrima]
MANPIISVPLFEKVFPKNTYQRAVDVTILFLLFCLLIFRLLSFNNHGLAWFSLSYASYGSLSIGFSLFAPDGLLCYTKHFPNASSNRCRNFHP